jgi:hypothetical protein
MADPPDVNELSAAPKKIRTDEAMVEERSVDELIEADRYHLEKNSATHAPFGLRIARSVPRGTV